MDKTLAANRLELESMRGRLLAAEVTIREITPQVERLARADEVADAVKRVIWKAAAALGAVLVGLATIAGVIIAYFH